jgi:DNA-binding SARP family transcriptional activator/tetratricopeptide (TPR) repeat protein
MTDPTAAEPKATVRFGVLGPLQVADGAGAAGGVPAAKQRIVLAALLLSSGRVVSAAGLAEALWDASPPPNAPVVMRTYVSRLRRALGPVGARIVGQPPGWAVEFRGPEEFDLAEVDDLWRAAQGAGGAGEWGQVSSLLARALSLWRGEPLIDVPSAALARREAGRLAELRLQLTEARIDADLYLGRHRELAAELRRLAAEHPLREHIRVQLMLACYRCGNQGAALGVYRDARATLAEELGVDPGPELREMHQKILAADPGLTAVAPARLTIGQTGGDFSRQRVPRQLPSAVGYFTGRTAELKRLTELAEESRSNGAATISVIAGMAGVGKTALALHWAHQVAGRFADGQLYVNLRGFDPSGTPVTPTEAIRGFLGALGVPPGQIPPSPEAQAGLYRSLLAERRMLIVADNARDELQVRPLLPASPGSLVLVTSRSQLPGLAAAEGARLISLDVLSHAEAVQLLAARLGAPRAAAQPAAVDQIASLCVYLPLALAIAAARASARPGFPLAALVGELADSVGRLDALDAGDPGSSVRAVFSWSTRQLSDQAARMFRLLGIHPGPDISVLAAASLAAMAEVDARRVLRELARAHLIAEHVPGRYAFHDLLRAYAAEQAHRTGSEADRAAATGRVLDHYLHTAAGAARLLMPAQELVVLGPPRPGAASVEPADHRQALAWFEAEHQVLLAALALAAGSGFDAHAWQVPWAMSPFLQARGHWQEWAATQRTALAAATRLGDTAALALSGRLLANACTGLGDHDQALGHYASSLTLYQRLGDRLGEAKVQQNLGHLAALQGRYADALGHAEQALRPYQAIGDKASEAEALNAVGWFYGLLGDYQQARAFCRQALTLSAEIGHRWTEGNAWDSLGYAEHHLGNLAEAAACHQRALSLHRECGDRFHEAEALTHLGDTRQAAGELAQAREAWQQALAILEDLQHPDAGQVRARLASTYGHASPRACRESHPRL